MGKKSRHKKEKKKQGAKQADARSPNGRRRFMKLAAASAATAFTALIGPGFFRDDKWAFLNRETKLNAKVSLEYIYNSCVPLCPERILPEGLELERIIGELGPEIMAEAKRRNFEPSIAYRINPTDQFFGVPDKERFTAPLLDYCKTSINFLYDNIRGLQEKNLEWVVLKHGDNFKLNSNHKGFIGRSWYHAIKATLTNPLHPEKSFFKVTIEHNRGGMNIVRLNEKIQPPIEWFIFISTGPYALTTTFSEVIPISMIEKTEEYSKKVDYIKTIQAVETLSEGISYILGVRLAQEMNVPNGVEYIKNMQKKTSSLPRYTYVSSAIRWMQKNGVQNAYDLYMESPAKFMQEIMKA